MKRSDFEDRKVTRYKPEKYPLATCFLELYWAEDSDHAVVFMQDNLHTEGEFIGEFSMEDMLEYGWVK